MNSQLLVLSAISLFSRDVLFSCIIYVQKLSHKVTFLRHLAGILGVGRGGMARKTEIMGSHGSGCESLLQHVSSVALNNVLYLCEPSDVKWR